MGFYQLYILILFFYIPLLCSFFEAYAGAILHSSPATVPEEEMN